MDEHDWDERYRGKHFHWSLGPNRFLVEELEGAAPGTVLDVACGEGRNAFWMESQGHRVRAFDFSRVAIDKARGRAQELGSQVDFEVASVEEGITGSYDWILIFYLHLPRPAMRACFEQAARCLRPGGTLLYVGHHERNLEEGVGGPQDASILYGPEELAGFLSDLELERADTVLREVSDESGTRDAIDVLVRARRPE